MSSTKLIGKIKIQDIRQNNDGTYELLYKVPDDIKQYIKNYFKWKRWSSKKFNNFLLEALINNPEHLERESGIGSASDQHRTALHTDKSI